jgi:hypothetical protein
MNRVYANFKFGICFTYAEKFDEVIYISLCIYIYIGGGHGNFGEEDIMQQECLEETPKFDAFCIGNITYLNVDPWHTHQVDIYSCCFNLLFLLFFIL